ncbi:MAG: anthranilate phosphoribosyltransferase [Candidatus Bathyarchaeia archaeon]
MALTEKQALQKAVEKLTVKKNLEREEIFKVLEEIKIGRATNAQIGGFLVGLVMKGVTVDELSAIAEWMRQNAIVVKPKVKGQIIDTCGTGGGLLTFNVSTANAIMAAAAGIPVAKHGSRSISHKSGSADVLEALGVNINLTKEQAESLIEKVGFAFLYAPLFHPVMSKVLGPESELGIKTVFYTAVGPLISPAHVKAHLLGVYKKELVEPIAHVLANLGYVRALVVHGLDGLDEISNVGLTLVAEVRDGRVADTYNVSPEELGVQRTKIEKLQPEVDNPKCNAEIIKKLFKGEKLDGKRDFLLLNAAGALYVGGAVRGLEEGVEVARNILDEKQAYRKLEEIAEASYMV